MKKLLYVLLLISTAAFAQDLSGRWVAVTGFESGYYAELFLVQNSEGVYAGHCYDTESGGYCRHWLDGTYNAEAKEFIGLDMELINKSDSHEPTDYMLKYEKDENGREYLVGTSVIIPYYNRPYGIMRPNKSQLFDLRFKYRSPATVVRYVKVADDYKIYNDDMPLAMTNEQILFEKAAFPEVFEEEEIAKLNEMHQLQKAPELLSFPSIFDRPMSREKASIPDVPKTPQTPATPEIKETPELKEPIDLDEKQENIARGEEETAELEIAEVESETDEIPGEVEVPGYEVVQVEKPEIEQTITEKRLTRSDQIFSHLRLQTNKVTLLIVDYGTIDNDTVTIFYNNKIIADGIRLTHTAAEFELELEPDQRNELVFVANNLGDIPPNTARVTLIADKKRYSYKLFSDEQSNAVILLENIARLEDD